jgi:hypothetical protein
LPDPSYEPRNWVEPIDFKDAEFRSGSCVQKGTVAVDTSGLKGRIGEALVEGVLREARFKVSRLGRESQVQQLLKTGSSEFLPDFLIWKPVDQLSDGVPLHRLLSVEVKYRSNVEEFLRRFGDDLISRVGEQWRELYVVFVTDHPAAGRSCFQVLDFREPAADAPLGTIDLHESPVFGISKSLIEEHERLVGQLFSPLSSPSMSELTRRPLTRLSPHRTQPSSADASASSSSMTSPRSTG